MPKASKQTCCWGSINDSAISLLSHNVPCCSCAFIRSINMDFINQIPILIFHFLEGNIPQNTSIVNKNINFSKIISSCFDYLLSKLYWIIVGNSNSSFGFNLFDYFISSIVAISLSSSWSSQVIYNNFSTSRSKE